MTASVFASQQWAIPAPPPIVPLVSADFKNGVYSISGVSKTLTQVFHEDLTNWSPWDSATVVAGTGFKKFGGDAAQGGPALTAAAMAALGSEFICVYTVDLFASPGYHNLTINTCYCDVPDFANGLSSNIGGYGNVPYWLMTDFGSLHVGDKTVADGHHKAALLMQAAHFAGSLDGAAVTATNAANNNAAANFFAFSLLTDGSNASSYITCEKIEFFSLSDYSESDLPGLSA